MATKLPVVTAMPGQQLALLKHPLLSKIMELTQVDHTLETTSLFNSPPPAQAHSETTAAAVVGTAVEAAAAAVVGTAAEAGAVAAADIGTAEAAAGAEVGTTAAAAAAAGTV